LTLPILFNGGEENVDYRQLRYFVAVADGGGFTQAARNAGASQPTVSASVRRLEQELGGPLFERDRRALRLTAGGSAFLPHARRVLLAADDARAAVTDADAEPGGEVRLGSVSSPLGLDMVRFVARLREEHPLVTPRLVMSRTPEEFIEDVRHGRLDLALSATLAPDAAPSGVELTQVYSQPFVLQVGPSHRLASREVVTVDDVRDEPFVVFPTDNSQRAGMDGVFAQIGLEPRIAFECDGPAHLRLVLEAGVCCLGLVRPTIDLAPEIRNIPFDIEMPRAYLVLVQPSSFRRSAPARAVAGALLRALL